ncbi:MAG: aminoglycoside phosphotransferase family protein [Actinomycetes bacterium]
MGNTVLPPVPDSLRENLAFVLGAERAEAWLVGAVERARELAQQWRLLPQEVLTGGSFSLCLRCVDDAGAETVLKVPASREDGAAEIAALQAWSGDGAARVLRVDPESSSMLMDFLGRVGVGDYGLADIVDLAERLHRGCPDGFGFAEVHDNLDRRVDWARDRFTEAGYEHHLDDLRHAEKLVAELAAGAGEQVLLHGDLQAKNLIVRDGELVAVDPMPVLGPPLFDLAFWIAKSYHARPTRTYVDEVSRLRPGIDGGELLRWTWALAVLENRPYLARGAAARQEFIDEVRELVTV